MGIPAQQSPKPFDQPAQRTGVGNQQVHAPGSDSRQRSGQDRNEPIIAGHENNNGGSGPTGSRSQDASPPQSTPPNPDQHQDLQGIGAWADKYPSYPTSNRLNLA